MYPGVSEICFGPDHGLFWACPQVPEAYLGSVQGCRRPIFGPGVEEYYEPAQGGGDLFWACQDGAEPFSTCPGGRRVIIGLYRRARGLH